MFSFLVVRISSREFLFQGIDVGTDGGLGQIQLAGGFGEAFIFYNSYEGL